MYKPKHEKSVKGLRKYKKSGILIVSLILLLTLTVGGTLAYLMDVTGALVNSFTPTSADITVEEDFTNNVKKSVIVKNEGDFPVYVRATLAIYWIDSNGVIVEPDTCDHSSVVIAVPWVEQPAGSGIYYYPTMLKPGDSTTNLLAQPITATVMPDGVEYRLVVEVLAEAIQAEPVDAVKDAWGFVPGTGGGT